MKIAIALRTCGTVYNYWNVSRIIDATKPTIMLTCLNSLLRSIESSKHEILFSIHDDSSTAEQKLQMEELANGANIPCEFIDSGKKNNFKTQYHWLKETDCDYVYMVEDDYLHRNCAIDDMIDVCEEMREFWPAEYAVYPMNHPHRYASPQAMYPVYVLRGKRDYWRSAFHSTATFFMSKKSANEYDDILRHQAYSWEINGAPEDDIINKLWQKQEVRLLYPMRSLAWHLSDEPNRDFINDWEHVWKDNLIEDLG